MFYLPSINGYSQQSKDTSWYCYVGEEGVDLTVDVSQGPHPEPETNHDKNMGKCTVKGVDNTPQTIIFFSIYIYYLTLQSMNSVKANMQNLNIQGL